MQHEPEVRLALADARIVWILDHPCMSDWVKRALRTADGLDPVTLQNDVELLRRVLLSRIEAQIDIAVAAARAD